jgi:outer membrane protein TolC
VTFEQQVPQELVAVAMQAFADHLHSVAQCDLADLGRRPSVVAQALSHEPRSSRVVDRVVQRRHQVRLAETALTDHDNGRP